MPNTPILEERVIEYFFIPNRRKTDKKIRLGTLKPQSRTKIRHYRNGAFHDQDAIYFGNAEIKDPRKKQVKYAQPIEIEEVYLSQGNIFTRSATEEWQEGHINVFYAGQNFQLKKE